jgi:hypothetical protein
MNKYALADNAFLASAFGRLKDVLSPISLNATLAHNPKISLKN